MINFLQFPYLTSQSMAAYHTYVHKVLSSKLTLYRSSELSGAGAGHNY